MSRSDAYYKEYLIFVRNEVVEILINDRMFSETVEIIRANQQINTSNSFFDWMLSAYVSDITIRIRRLMDRRSDVKSFLKFLEEIKTDRVYLSRSRFVGVYAETSKLHGDSVFKELGERDFDNLAGVGAAEYTEDQVQQDIKVLKDVSESIINYTNDFITHSKANIDTSNLTRQLPTFGEVKEAIKSFEKIIIKYDALIECAGGHRGTLMPTWQYNWKSIFRVPWITLKD